MAQIDQTRPGEPIPGLADQIIRHTRAYNTQHKKGVDSHEIIALDTDTIYNLCPFGDVIREHPGHVEWNLLREFHNRLQDELTVKGKNEWAKRLLDHLTEANAPVKETPFWKR